MLFAFLWAGRLATKKMLSEGNVEVHDARHHRLLQPLEFTGQPLQSVVVEMLGKAGPL